MAGGAILAAALTTPVTRTLVVFAGGTDITGDVKWSTFSVTDSGTNAKGTASMTIEGAASSFTSITDQCMVRVEEPAVTASPEVFRGFLRARRPGKDPRHPTLELIADDLTSLLDDTFIPVELRQPETMQARIGYLWGQYAGQFLSGDLSFVASVGSTLPLQRFEAVSLRQAIEMTIAQASSTADYYVDMLGKLHVFTTESNDAPFDIDADAPGGGEIAPEMLDVEYDANAYANRVYVKGATPAASLWVQDEAAIAAANGLVRSAMIQAGDVTSATMARSLGQMYLGRVKTAKPRGVFVTHSPNDGWRAGQNVLVTSADHGLSAQSYRIARVTTKVLKPGSDFKRSYRVEFGGTQAGSGIDGQAPLIAGATGGVYMLDQLSSSIVSNAASAEFGGLGPALRRYITSSLYNSDFYAPPPGPDAPIDDDTNPLPYWTIATVGVAESFSVVASSAGSGRRLQMQVLSGTGPDTSLLNQRSPINASDSNAYFHNVKAFVTNIGGTNPSQIGISLTARYHTISGNVTGTLGSNSATLSGLGIGGSTTLSVVVNGGRVPSNAYYISVDLQFDRIGGSADVGAIQVSEVWIESGQGTVPQGATATRTTTQSITQNTWTAIQFNATDISDPFGFHDPASNNTRFTVPTGWGGTYLLVGQGGFAGHTGTRNIIGWALNGEATPSDPHTSTYATISGVAMSIGCTAIRELAAGDYVELKVHQNSAGAVDTQATVTGSIYYIGETA